MDLMALVIYKGIARRVLLPCSSEEVAERFGYEGQEIEVIIDSILMIVIYILKLQLIEI